MNLDYRVQIQSDWLHDHATFGWSLHLPRREHAVKFLRISAGRAHLAVTVRNLNRRRTHVRT